MKNEVTRDMTLAAFLLQNKIKPKRVFCRGWTVFFEFSGDKTLTNLIDDFYAKKTTVEPLKFLDSVKKVRKTISRVLEKPEQELDG